MMQEFDKDGDGTVNCSEFLLTFFRLGFDARNKALKRFSDYPQQIEEFINTSFGGGIYVDDESPTPAQDRTPK